MTTHPAPSACGCDGDQSREGRGNMMLRAGTNRRPLARQDWFCCPASPRPARRLAKTADHETAEVQMAQLL
eukprot:1967328-Pyramimonas_sp.AAC.1